MRKTNKEYLKDFYDKLPDEKKFKTCPDCGCKYSYPNKTHHLKSKIHNLIVQRIKENIEMIKNKF